MNTNATTDFQNRKVTKRMMNDDINEIRNTLRIDYFKDENERMNLLRESGAVLYFTSEIVKANDEKSYNVTSWVYEIPNLMRFFYPDFRYCILAGYLLNYHVRSNLERANDESIGDTTTGSEVIEKALAEITELQPEGYRE
jgi:hypothetical protein